MPIYEYECDCCLFRFDLKRSFSESSPVCCPQCGSNVQRVFAPVPIIFKGSGFYVTDSRKNQGLSSDEGDTGKTKTGTAGEGG